MENKFRKPTRLRGTPAHKYVNLYSLAITTVVSVIGAGLIIYSPDILSDPNSRFNRLSRFFDDPEKDQIRNKLNRQLMKAPIREEDALRNIEIAKGEA
ncbi:hypothetical protein M8J76_013029 [Diaphorina citri]|nr:hypothetical protein M8J75_014768 [Diaphorina citri]KAI5745641.1 hypothetical protein M8J76_013029 [Diaphorina citri]KAI5751571.1 hypothetical protein M8J77_008761 [Diaphorina citri]